MKPSTSSDDYLNLLFAQDSLLNSKEFEDHRRKVIERLARAQQQERRARRITVIAFGCCATLFIALYASALRTMPSGTNFPEWLVKLMALVIILSPLTALLLSTIYFFRYRWEFVRARREARSQALLEMPRQIADLRKELHELREQLARDPKEKNPPEKRERGFTLLELLMVIAILGVFASLLLPGLAAAKARGRTTTCKNNLRQMGHALAMYESDFRCFPGAGNDMTPIGEPPWFVLSEESWVAKITPYLAINSPIFTCPDYQPLQTNSQCYGYNAGGSCQMNYPPHDLGLGLGKGFGFIAMSGVRVPADMIALGDLQLPSQVARFVISPWHKQPLAGVDSVIPLRHAGGSDMVFVDTHVEWLKRPRWIEETSALRLRWNNDHQPHPETW